MATYRPLALGLQPRVLTFAHWLLRDPSVARAARSLRRAPGSMFWHDGQTAILIVPECVLRLPEVEAAFYALLDELTVWRLATHDGARIKNARRVA
jgi:hypothetical protein